MEAPFIAAATCSRSRTSQGAMSTGNRPSRAARDHMRMPARGRARPVRCNVSTIHPPMKPVAPVTRMVGLEFTPGLQRVVPGHGEASGGTVAFVRELDGVDHVATGHQDRLVAADG